MKTWARPPVLGLRHPLLLKLGLAGGALVGALANLHCSCGAPSFRAHSIRPRPSHKRPWDGMWLFKVQVAMETGCARGGSQAAPRRECAHSLGGEAGVTLTVTGHSFAPGHL